MILIISSYWKHRIDTRWRTETLGRKPWKPKNGETLLVLWVNILYHYKKNLQLVNTKPYILQWHGNNIEHTVLICKSIRLRMIPRRKSLFCSQYSEVYWVPVTEIIEPWRQAISEKTHWAISSAVGYLLKGENGKSSLIKCTVTIMTQNPSKRGRSAMK